MTLSRVFCGPHVVLLTVAVVVAGCDRLNKLAEGDDATKASTASAEPGGLPPECIDYLEVLQCASTKSDPATANAQTDAARNGFKTLATNAGAAAAKKQCAELMAGSQVGFAQLGCTKGAAAAVAKTAKTAVPATAAKPAEAPKPTARAASTTPAPKATGVAATATATATATPGKARCPKGTLRAKGGGCDVPTCKTDDDCSTHACSLVREGVRACSGSIDLIDDSEFQ